MKDSNELSALERRVSNLERGTPKNIRQASGSRLTGLKSEASTSEIISKINQIITRLNRIGGN